MLLIDTLVDSVDHHVHRRRRLGTRTRAALLGTLYPTADPPEGNSARLMRLSSSPAVPARLHPATHLRKVRAETPCSGAAASQRAVIDTSAASGAVQNRADDPCPPLNLFLLLTGQPTQRDVRKTPRRQPHLDLDVAVATTEAASNQLRARRHAADRVVDDQGARGGA